MSPGLLNTSRVIIVSRYTFMCSGKDRADICLPHIHGVRPMSCSKHICKVTCLYAVVFQLKVVMGGCFFRECKDVSTQTDTPPQTIQQFSQIPDTEVWIPPPPYGPPPAWFEDLDAYHWWHEQAHQLEQLGQPPSAQPPPPTTPPLPEPGRPSSSNESFGQ